MLLKDVTTKWIREHRDDKDQLNWSVISAHYDFTIDQLREFADYIDWDSYFIYHYRHSQNIPEGMEFSDKCKENNWVWMWRLSKKPKVEKEYLKRYIWEIVEYDHSWRYIVKAQKLDKKFLLPYAKYIECIDVEDLVI